MTSSFIHLHLHSEYSLFDGLANVEGIVAQAKVQGHTAIALTDQMNLFGLVKFYQACRSQGIKPIIGATIYIENPKDLRDPFEALLLCQNQSGYKNLCELLSQGFCEGQAHGKAILKRDWITAHTEGLILLSGAQKGDVGRMLLAQNTTQAEQYLSEWKAAFPNRYYLELQRVGLPFEEAYIQAVLPLAKTHALPVVATGAVRFLKPEDFDAHEARVAIHAGYVLTDPKRPKHYSAKQYLQPLDEMIERFKDIPSSIENSVEIGKRCNLTLTLGKVFLPHFPLPSGYSIKDYLTELAEKGLAERFTQLNVTDPTPYNERLARELDLIIRMDFAGYFLIVADFIQWAKDQDIPVGPGRGSGAGSLVAYALKITDIDPLAYDLLFERFLNPERISMPDFDIDFCVQGRDRVIDYVTQKYGRTAVSQIITYGTMAAKAVVRDVGRVLSQPYGFVDKLAKLIPFEVGMTLAQAFKQEPELEERYKKEEEVAALFDLARKLEGVVRNVGTHAGGVVIAPSKLTDFMPIYCEENNSNLVSQLDKYDVEEVGLVKFDFLGLRTLTLIDWTLKNIHKSNSQLNIDLSRIPLDDPATYNLLKACDTTAVFQLESRGMKDLIKRLQPDCFDDVVSLVALFRPGPLQSGMVDDFINRKQGRAKIEYLHPLLEPILKSTYGVIVYQEQVMQIAQSMAGYTLGGADLLRKAMGKKKPEEMANQRLVFVNGASDKGIDNAISSHIFDLMEKFAGYGFNKSHSVAYALLAYQTAWLKAHYPAEFMAAVLSSDLQNTDKIVVFFHDAKQSGLTILPPDVNESHYHFTVTTSPKTPSVSPFTGGGPAPKHATAVSSSTEGESAAKHAIRYGLGAIKGIGESAIEAIVNERTSQGPFTDLFSLCERVGLAKLNRRTLEALVKSGALDSFDVPRSHLLASIDKAIHQAEQSAHNQRRGQGDLFTALEAESPTIEYMEAKPWHEAMRLAHEKSVLGLFLSGHPVTQYSTELAPFKMAPISSVSLQEPRKLLLCGLISRLRLVQTKRGHRMAIITLEDPSGESEIALFSDLYEARRPLIEAGRFVILEGDTRLDNYSNEYRFNAQQLWSIESWRIQKAKALLLDFDSHPLSQDFLAQLETLLQSAPRGAFPLWVDYQNQSAKARFTLNPSWNITPSDECLELLQTELGTEKVRVLYEQ